MMMDRSKADIKRTYQSNYTDFSTLFIKGNWVNGRYHKNEWNEYKRQIATDNFAESTNWLVTSFVEVHTPFFHWMFLLKKFNAKHTTRWRRFKEKGFERLSSVDEHMKQLHLKHLWNQIGNAESGLSLYDYMNAMRYVYKKQWKKVQEISGPIEYENDAL